MIRRLQAIRTKLRRNQKGFTLIEMLVVISILGILAAVVTMSLVGVTNYAHTSALKTERSTVQSALDTYISTNQLQPSDVCPAGLTTDMTDFPKQGNGLAPSFLRSTTTQQAYSCDDQGVVKGSVTGTG